VKAITIMASLDEKDLESVEIEDLHEDGRMYTVRVSWDITLFFDGWDVLTTFMSKLNASYKELEKKRG